MTHRERIHLFVFSTLLIVLTVENRLLPELVLYMHEGGKESFIVDHLRIWSDDYMYAPEAFLSLVIGILILLFIPRTRPRARSFLYYFLLVSLAMTLAFGMARGENFRYPFTVIPLLFVLWAGILRQAIDRLPLVFALLLTVPFPLQVWQHALGTEMSNVHATNLRILMGDQKVYYSYGDIQKVLDTQVADRARLAVLGVNSFYYFNPGRHALNISTPLRQGHAQSGADMTELLTEHRISYLILDQRAVLRWLHLDGMRAFIEGCLYPVKRAYPFLLARVRIVGGECHPGDQSSEIGEWLEERR